MGATLLPAHCPPLSCTKAQQRLAEHLLGLRPSSLYPNHSRVALAPSTSRLGFLKKKKKKGHRTPAARYKPSNARILIAETGEKGKTKNKKEPKKKKQKKEITTRRAAP